MRNYCQPLGSKNVLSSGRANDKISLSYNIEFRRQPAFIWTGKATGIQVAHQGGELYGSEQLHGSKNRR